MTFRDEIQTVLPDLLTDRSTRRRLPVDAETLLPRWRKRQAEQAERTRTKAEVATPSWLARDMTEMIETELMGDWQAYVRAKCLEITCGEAPFLCQMYDCVSGRQIPVSERGGIFDRKLRRVSEHCETYGRWNLWALYALQACYGYEYQADSLALARINLLTDYLDTCESVFGTPPDAAMMTSAAVIISWNLWQMDGLKGQTPDGRECLIRDWEAGEYVRWSELLDGCRGRS